jgi:peptidoglycan hydrolase CwlO-like protein
MNLETIITILGSGTFTGIIGYFTGKRRSSAETDSVVLKNLELSVNIYAEIIQDLKQEIESLNRKIQDLEQKIDELHEENKKLRTNI